MEDQISRHHGTTKKIHTKDNWVELYVIEGERACSEGNTRKLGGVLYPTIIIRGLTSGA